MYKTDSIVYTYSSIYDKKRDCYDSIDYERYNEDNNIIEEFHASSIDKNLVKLPYYKTLYINDGKEYSSKILRSLDAFKHPLSFYNPKYHSPKKLISKQILLEGGFTITEEVPYGFIYHDGLDGQFAVAAKKYGLVNTGDIDYGKLISEYYIDNDMLIVSNKFLEYYNYIASSKKDSHSILTQDTIFFTNSTNIFLDNCPKNMTLSDRGKVIDEIDITYSLAGLTTTMIINGEDKCVCEKEDNICTSIHPLLYEPFCFSLYRDIVLDHFPYDVLEEYENTSEYTRYERTIIKS